jgi:alginate O-acetyltransferase complex protein AlgI
MLFVEPRFLIFFATVFVFYWSVRSDVLRKATLLVASYAFYSAWDYRFTFLIMFSTLVDYSVARLIEAESDPKRRRRFLLVSLCMNLGVLGFFKYFNFFAASTVDLLNTFGLTASWTTLHIVLPVGVSFFTFQSLSYTIDVYRGKLKARKSLFELALFIAFFPQLIAGPIVRAFDFLPQFDRPRRFDMVRARLCLALFIIGFFKKACVSDNIAPIIDMVFAAPDQYDGPSVVAGVLLYAVQIYCDFSGYTEMAIGLAGLLGYNLTENFHWPYFSPSITDFWRRWHISLSSWLRDYLYISLGGNHGSKLFTYRNLMLTMVLGGLWHGASYNFSIWGFLHGLALIVNREWSIWSTRLRIPSLPRPLAIALTFWWVCLAWIFFRAQDLSAALGIAGSFLTWQGTGDLSLGWEPFGAILILGALHWTFSRLDLAKLAEQMPRLVYPVVWGTALALALGFMPVGQRPFIYFQF